MSDNIESMLLDMFSTVAVLDAMCKKVYIFTEKIIKIESKLECLDTKHSDLENGTGFLETGISQRLRM